MELNIMQKKKSCALTTSLFLAAVFAMMLATLGQERQIPVALVGAVLPLIPVFRTKKGQLMLLTMVALFGIIRFSAIFDGMKLLANTMFRRSEETQAYEYVYFAATGSSVAEAVAFAACLLGSMTVLWGSGVCAVTAGVWLGAMAYFGVTPGVVWLAAALLAGVLMVLPEQRLLYGGIAAVLIASLALVCTTLAPEPNPAISDLDEQLRDLLAFRSVAYEQMPVPTQVPEPEMIPPPDVQQEQPDHGVQPKFVNVLFLLLATLTLALLFIPAFIQDHAAKCSEKTRQGLRDGNPAKAIQAMYLYAMRWREAGGGTEPVPENVYAIWQEAAFSDHPMTDAQAETVRLYMKETAQTAWNQADRRQKLRIRYRLYL